VTEVIKDQGGEETSTEYFAALLTTLEATDTEDGLAAVVSLLSMVIKTVPQEIIRSRFSKVRSSLGLLVYHISCRSSFILAQESCIGDERLSLIDLSAHHLVFIFSAV